MYLQERHCDRKIDDYPKDTDRKLGRDHGLRPKRATVRLYVAQANGRNGR
jgi:hypothetical protein